MVRYKQCYIYSNAAAYSRKPWLVSAENVKVHVKVLYYIILIPVTVITSYTSHSIVFVSVWIQVL